MEELTWKERNERSKQSFNLTTALFCGGLAFDAYAEPPANSSRWERGSQGMNVAFQSPAFTRSLYRGLLEVTPLQCTDLPDEDDTAEGLMTGGGVDAYLLVGVVEGKWTEDIKLIEKEKYNEGVWDLRGCAHVGRGTTAWSNVNENMGKAKKKRGGSGAYHVPSSWGKAGKAVWEGDPPFYLYVQDPSVARLVFTVMDDDVVGDGTVVGSAFRKLSDLHPNVKEKDAVKMLKSSMLERIKKGDDVSGVDLAKSVVQEWQGGIKLSSKPKIKDKKGQVAGAAMAGAMVAGPAGAAVGGLLANFYEGDPRGRIEVKLRYLPIPDVPVKRKKYKVKGGLPGVNWGELYERHLSETQPKSQEPPRNVLGEKDLEFCFFINHEKTGCSCAVYRSLEKRVIVVSFRGTTVPKDLITDASVVQEAWVEGEDVENPFTAKVHAGFRQSLQSISRRLKELILASVAPGDDFSQYDILITGHSLGGALATLFTADVAEYGMDAGRALPQLQASEPWWISLASTLAGKSGGGRGKSQEEPPPPPPRPKSLKMYNFGSPRVGNDVFVKRFESFMGNGIDEAYRIVNGDDIVARLPRTMNAFVLGSMGYEHCGPTVLVTVPKSEKPSKGNDNDNNNNLDLIEFCDSSTILWVEGENDDRDCPVRDGVMLSSPLSDGALLGDILSAVQKVEASTATTTTTTTSTTASLDDPVSGISSTISKLSSIAEQVTGRLQKLTVNDITSIVGIDKNFGSRELRIVQTLLSGEALAHHLEDEYYLGMGRAAGYLAIVGKEIRAVGGDGGGGRSNVEESEGEEEDSAVYDEGGGGDVVGDLELWDAQLEALEEEEG